MFTEKTYSARRAELRRSLTASGENGVVLLLGNSEAPRNYADNSYAMRQDSTFLYYFGLGRHDLAAILDLDGGYETIYGNDYTVDDIIWMGPQKSVAEQAACAGVKRSAPLDQLATTVTEAVAKGRRVHILPPYRADNRAKLMQMLPSIEASTALIEAVVAGREIKTDQEIAQIEEACEIGYQMHTTAMRMCKAGTTELDIAGAIEGVALRGGAGVSFHSIVSQRGETLHNHDHSGVLKEGSLLLVDAGAENVMNYCCDFTRTLPVSGKFTARQRDIYQIVLAANRAGHELSRPDVTYQSVQLDAATIIAEGLKSLSLMRGNTHDAVLAGAPAMFMPHGLGHQMGLDVHDMEDLGERFVGYNRLVERSTIPGLASLRMGKMLRAGHVITVEPGIYFIPALVEKWAAEGRCAEFIDFDKVRSYFGFGGIRLEDDILITQTGSRQLGKQRTPITIDDLELFMS